MTFSIPPNSLPATTPNWPSGCVFPSGITTPQAANDTLVGADGRRSGSLTLTPLKWPRSRGAPLPGTDAAGNTTYTFPFAAGDKLKMNQAGSTVTNSLAKLPTSTQTSAQRLMVVSYYLDNTPAPPRLMRQVSGHTPMPVAENIVYMKFSYDMYNDVTTQPAPNQCNPGDNRLPAIS